MLSKKLLVTHVEQVDTEVILKYIEDDVLVNTLYVAQNKNYQTVLFLVEGLLDVEPSNRIELQVVIEKLGNFNEDETNSNYFLNYL